MKSTQEFAVGKNNISYISSAFKEHFHGISFEESTVELVSRKLPKSMTSKEIVEEWNPEPVTLGDILHVLPDLDREEWYVFYVKDVNGVLWAVRGGWYGGGWGFDAYPLDSPGGWDGVRQFLSRRFSDTQKETLCNSDTLTLRVEKLEKILKHYNLTEI